MLDQFQLIAIDHDPGTEIAVLSDGKIIQYTTPFALDGNSVESNLLTALQRFDDGASVRVSQEQIFNLLFKSTDQTTSGVASSTGVLLGGWLKSGRKEIATGCPPSCKSSVVGFAGSGSNVVEGGSTPFTFRERPTIVYVSLNAETGGKVSLRFADNTVLDYAMLARISDAPYNNQVLALDRKSTRLNSSHIQKSRMPSSA